ncbi:M3 family metallopeptidase [Stackebrandtia soli]|uniref:M3 family metallopeptidase n=1 Tax=Stackebrandtia soli TaxID=1892856 RepID=UPI0039EBFE9D
MTASINPLLSVSTLPYQIPPFDAIADEHYQPAIEEGIRRHLAEVAAIAEDVEPPTFDNTIVALERSGELAQRAGIVFYNKVSADTNPTLRTIQAELAPKLAAYTDAIRLNDALFQRIETLWNTREELDLDAESAWLLHRYRLDFVRAGAQLSPEDKDRLRAFNEELSSLSTTFGQNQLEGTNEAAVLFDDVAALDGLSPDAITAAAAAATERGEDGKYLLTLSNFTNQPQLAALTDPETRARLYTASINRGGNGSASDNSEIILKIVRLRAERAKLLGFADHADYAIADQTAGSTQAALAMLAKLAPAAVANVTVEAADRAAVLAQESIAPQDWSLATEKLRKQRYDFDAAAMRPYFELEKVLIDGVFYAASKLYGLSFTERFDLPAYHPQVRVFEVFNEDGSPLGLFLADYYTRDSKNGGAWMNAVVPQSGLLARQPVIVNNLNISKPADGPTLMTMAEVTTMFHEFGHALHGLFSNVTYPRFSGTSVPRDFVEFPSQVNEMWALWPEVLANYAVHYETKEPMPQDMVDKLLASQQYNEGFATTEYLAAALLDLAWHRVDADGVPSADDARASVAAFEAAALADAGVAVTEVAPRYRSTYFGHIFGGGYSAGYYSYIWSEVLGKHSEQWFADNGGLSRANGDHFRTTLLSRGGSVDPMRQFRDFTGADPDIVPLLKARGLDAAI